MEVELGLPFAAMGEEFKGLFGAELNNKRRCDQVVTKAEQQSSASCGSWPLVLWSGKPNDDDDDDDRGGKRKKNSCSTSMHVADDHMRENDDHVIVGWPPIKAWRRKMLQPNQAGQIMANIRNVHVRQEQGRAPETPEA